MKYAVVIEKAGGNHSACVPDLPGCAATGTTIEEAEAGIREAIALHRLGMRADGLALPEPASRVGYADLAAQAAPRACCAPPTNAFRLRGPCGWCGW